MLAVLRAQTVARHVPRVLRPSHLQAAAFSWDAWFERERAAEKIYFTKQDDLALRKLMYKLKGKDEMCLKARRDMEARDKQALAEIPGLKLDAQQVQALMQWKYDFINH